MDSSSVKMKQKSISAFFALANQKDTDVPKSAQRKISAFFGNVKSEPTSNGDKATSAHIATPPGLRNGPARLPRQIEDDAAGNPGEEPTAEGKGTTATGSARAPAAGSINKTKAKHTAAARGLAKATSKVKRQVKAEDEGNTTTSTRGRRKRLRRIVMDDVEGDDAVEAGLEDDDPDKGDLKDNDYEASDNNSDEDFSADDESEEEDEVTENGGDKVAAVGLKRKRSTKASASSKRVTTKSGTRGAAAADTTPARTATGGVRSDVATTPHHGTMSKGPTTASAGVVGEGFTFTSPGTVAPMYRPCGSAARSKSFGGGDLGTPLSSRSTQSAALTDTPSHLQGFSELTLGVTASMEGEAARFADRMATRFSFLHPDNIRDANRRRPDHPDYDLRTLFIPPNWFKEFKISEGQQQWWNFKAQNFDSVLLFKMGKFYEMFEMDAYVGVEVLGLTFMKGEQPHAGFPEVKYADMAERLARAGYRVVVVEQTETPDMLAKRNEQRKMQGKKQVNVVDRQKVAVLSRGTLVDAEMVASRPDASYVLAVAEVDVEGREVAVGAAGAVRLGLCAVDAASGQILIGEFIDDEIRSALRTQLTALQPQELVLPRKPLSATTSRVLRNAVRDPRINTMHGTSGDWSAEKTYQALRDAEYFTASTAAPTTYTAFHTDPEKRNVDTDMEVDEINAAGVPSRPELDPLKRWPSLLRSLIVDGMSSRPAAMAALGGIIYFLRDALLDRAVLPLGRFEELPALAPGEGGPSSGHESDNVSGPLYMALNGAALENLEILENSEGGSAGTLLSVLDNCATPFGRRRLRQWLCRPLGRITDIEARQDAVAELMGSLAEAAGQARKLLGGVSDLERAVARLHASTVSGASGRDASNVILYEDAGKRKVAALTSALKDLRAAYRALEKLRESLDNGSSELLRSIVIDRCRPAEVYAALEALEGATDWKEAAASGRAVPEQGVDEEYDAAVDAVEAVEQKMQAYLKEVRQRFGREVSLVSVNKDSNLLEVPDSLADKLGAEFHLVGNRKGYKRFTTNRLKGLVADHERALEVKEQVLSSILTRLLVKFASHKALWVAVIEAVADLDALMSLATHALSSPDGGPMCRPKLIPSRVCNIGDGNELGPVFDAVALRHPAGISGRNNGTFVPNDVRLGGNLEGGPGIAPSFMLLSGPNMGGKSTLLRQVCLSTVLAQTGAWVPAESLMLSPADAIFVRMGARDSIMTGQSTFFIELSETAAMLAKATKYSLVALDELGRGTATLDGAAVAGSVLQHLTTTTGCRGLFATHYHHLSDEHAADPRVAVMHMACAVEDSADVAVQESSGSEPINEVTFLYRLTRGACPKSYGTNVARLAGLPPRVVTRAAQVSARWNKEKQEVRNTETLMQGQVGDAPTVDFKLTVASTEVKSLLALIMSWRSQSKTCDMARLRRLQAEAAKLLGP
ncbi:hypothetical protein Vafri_15713 [Volvox africanus]|nr:hypothetical protein Vafri_15713 [Volvox africanus]